MLCIISFAMCCAIAGQAESWIGVGSVTADAVPGQVVVPVFLNNDADLSSLNVTFSYDPALLAVEAGNVQVIPGRFPNGTADVTCTVDSVNGRIVWSVASFLGTVEIPSENGPFLEVSFAASARLEGTATGVTVTGISGLDASLNSVSFAAPTAGLVRHSTGGPVPVFGAPASPAPATPLVFRLTFDRTVSGLDVMDFDVTNGSVDELTEVEAGRVFNVVVQPTAPGTVTVILPANRAVDAAQQGNSEARCEAAYAGENAVYLSRVIADAVPGTAVVQLRLASTVSLSSLSLQMEYNTESLDLTAGDVTPVASRFANGAETDALCTVDSDTGVIHWSLTDFLGQESVRAGYGTLLEFAFETRQALAGKVASVTISSVSAFDTSLNAVAVVEAGNGEVADAMPVTLQCLMDSPGNSSAIPFEAVFATYPTTLSEADFTVTNGTAVPGSLVWLEGGRCNLEVFPEADGEVSVTLTAWQLSDDEGRPNRHVGVSVVSDRTSPSLTNLTPVPSRVRRGTELQLSFSVSEELGATPTVALNALPMDFSEYLDGEYHFSLVVPSDMQTGLADLAVLGVDDAGNELSYESTAAVTVNTPPVVAVPVPNVETLEDNDWNFTLASGTFTDVDAGDTLTLSSRCTDDGAEPWWSFEAETGMFTGTPFNGHVGIWTVEVTATDSVGESVSDTFTVTVTNENDAPVNVTPPLVSGTHELGTVLTTTTGTWEDVDTALDQLSYEVSWQIADSKTGEGVLNRPGNECALTLAEDGKWIRATVTCHDNDPADPEFDIAHSPWTVVQRRVFSLLIEESDGNGYRILEFGEAAGTTDGYDDGWDKIPSTDDEGIECDVCLLSLTGYDELELRRDIRPIRELNRWLVVVTGIDPACHLEMSWDISGAEDGRVMYLQRLKELIPAGSPVDMHKENSFEISEDCQFEIVFGALSEVTLDLGEEWNLVGSPLISMQPVQDLFTLESQYPSVVDAMWYWQDGAYRPLKQSEPMCAETGYWCHATSGAKPLVMSGLPADGLFLLHEGWNAVSPTVDCKMPSLEYVDWSAWCWKRDKRQYAPILEGDPLEPGIGYWIFVNSDEVFLDLGAPL